MIQATTGAAKPSGEHIGCADIGLFKPLHIVGGQYIWTASDKEDEYRTIIKKIEKTAKSIEGNSSIAVWELCEWQKADSEADA